MTSPVSLQGVTASLLSRNISMQTLVSIEPLLVVLRLVSLLRMQLRERCMRKPVLRLNYTDLFLTCILM